MKGRVIPLIVKVTEVAKGKHKTSVIFDIIILHLTPVGEGDNTWTHIRRGVFLNIEYLKCLEGRKGAYISITTNHLD